jgi:hypothetical protein
MILVVENGRLGNQLFQYFGLRTAFPKEQLVLLGFGRFEQVVNRSNLKKTVILSFEKHRIIRFAVVKALNMLCKSRVLTQIIEHNTPANYSLEIKRGFAPCVRVIITADFQHSSVARRIHIGDISLSRQLLEQGYQALASLTGEFSERTPVFLHIRRGDYTWWPPSSSPAVLPIKWYLSAIEYFRETVDSPVFIVLTDDKPYAYDVFTETKDIVISQSDELIDLSIMANCHHGILSSSSFSWWGAYFARQRMQNSSMKTCLFLGPKPWIRESDSYIPPTPIVDWIDYLPRP